MSNNVVAFKSRLAGVADAAAKNLNDMQANAKQFAWELGMSLEDDGITSEGGQLFKLTTQKGEVVVSGIDLPELTDCLLAFYDRAPELLREIVAEYQEIWSDFDGETA